MTGTTMDLLADGMRVGEEWAELSWGRRCVIRMTAPSLARECHNTSVSATRLARGNRPGLFERLLGV